MVRPLGFSKMLVSYAGENQQRESRMMLDSQSAVRWLVDMLCTVGL